MAKKLSLFFLFLGIYTLLYNIRQIEEKQFLAEYPSSLQKHIKI